MAHDSQVTTTRRPGAAEPKANACACGQQLDDYRRPHCPRCGRSTPRT